MLRAKRLSLARKIGPLLAIWGWRCSPSVHERFVYDYLLASTWPFDAARATIAATTALWTALWAASFRTHGRPLRPPRLPFTAGASLLVLGLVAFAATRGEAADLRAPMQRLANHDRIWLPSGLAATAPAAAGCERFPESGPTLMWGPAPKPSMGRHTLGEVTYVRRGCVVRVLTPVGKGTSWPRFFRTRDARQGTVGG